MKKELVIIFLLLLFSLPAVRSLLIPGGFTSHDLEHHVIRQISMDKLLSEGQFPPRWSGELNNGFGYPVFLFNYPLPALVGEIFHKFGFGYVDSVKAVLFLSMIVSAVGMYLFLRALLGLNIAAFLGAVFYLYAPLRFLTVYVSAALGSALALGILPFVFWSIVEIKNGKKWAILVGGISLAGLILAHNVTALIFAPVILFFYFFNSRGFKINLRSFSLMLLLGLGLSAWFWMPAVIEAKYTRFGEIFGGFYKDQFPTLWQLLRSPWGYGLSHPQRPEAGDMSYQLGLVHIVVILVFSIWYIVYGRKNKERAIGIFCLVVFFVSVFLMLKVSLPLWESLPFLSLIQFPLRFQVLSVFSASIAAALLIKYIPFRKVGFVIMLVLVIYANRNHWHINQEFSPGEDYYLNLKTTSTSYGEHLPKWGRIMDKAPDSKVEFTLGAGEVKIIKDQSAQIVAEVESSASAKLKLNQFYFPGWEIKVDGYQMEFNYLEKGENYGLPVFEINSGSHLIEVSFKNTPVRNLADFISLASVILWIGILCKLLPRIL